jgi:hypothetical protein
MRIKIHTDGDAFILFDKDIDVTNKESIEVVFGLYPRYKVYLKVRKEKLDDALLAALATLPGTELVVEADGKILTQFTVAQPSINVTTEVGYMGLALK